MFFPITGDVYLLLEAYVCVSPEDVLHIATVEQAVGKVLIVVLHYCK